MSGISPGAGVAFGIIVGLISTCVQSVGLTLQRKSHMLEDEKIHHHLRRAPYRRRRWQIGMFLFLIANIIGSTIQITTLPLPLLSTLQASGLVFNSLLASLLLKEPWTWRTAWGTVLVAGGAVLISLFSALPEPSHSLRQLIELLWMRSFLIWFIMSLLFVLGVLGMTFFLQHCIAHNKRRSGKVTLIRGMSYGLISGVLSAHALLLAKSAVELIVRSIVDHNNQFNRFESWLLLLAFLFLALTQLYYLHRGLKLVSTSILYPFVFCIYNIVAILDGLIYFRQMDRLPPLHAGLIALGTVVLLSGVLALSWRLQDEEEQEDHAATAEIPQTVLAPGMGFVGDPESGTNSESAVSDDDYEEDSERTALLAKTPQAHSSSRSRRRSTPTVQSGRKRRRAATLKEVMNIWEELDDEDRYGTFAPSLARATSVGRPASTGHAERRSRSSGDHGDLEASGSTLTPAAGGDAPADEEEQAAGRKRARTMPASEMAGRRRRNVSGGMMGSRGQGSALFGDMLRLEWWRGKGKEEEPLLPKMSGGNAPHRDEQD
ncbi:hypothetical protein MBLNU230_g1840t1 [Neophaeotheca triangularis]